MKHALLILLAAAVSACAPEPDPVRSMNAPAMRDAPRLPGRVVLTDGKGDIAVAQAGDARCLATSRQQAQAVEQVTNALRRQRGLEPLSTDQRLQRAAERHACEMAQRGLMTHAGGSTKGPSDRVKAVGYRPRVTAENIAGGRFDVSQTLSQWSGSPGHVANIVIPSLDHVGFGHAYAADGKTLFSAAVYAQAK